MRIAFIVKYFPILSETFIVNQIVGLISRGHEVDIYSCDVDDTSKVQPNVEKYQLLDRTYYLPSAPQNLLWRSLKGMGLLLTNVDKEPLRLLRSLNFFKLGKPAASLRLLYTAIPALGKEPYDIIHCQFGTLSNWGMWFRKINSPAAKLIVSFRGFDISQEIHQQGDRVYNRIFAEADFFLTNCEFFKQRLLKLGCDEKKLVVHYSGIDCNQFFYTPRLPTDGKVQIATTGRLVEKKGIEYTIRAVAKLANHYNIEYNIIGDGPLLEELQQLIQELNVSNIVKLLGKKTSSEIIQILNTAHIFIAPSVTASNGNQDAPINVLKEAMCLGLPVISTFHGGIPELVQDGVSGFLVPERDADALAQKLSYLLEHPEIWNSMAQAGRAYVEKYFDMHKLNSELVEIYQQLLNKDSFSQPLSRPVTFEPI